MRRQRAEAPVVLRSVLDVGADLGCVSLKSLPLWNSGCHLAKSSQPVTGQDVNPGMSDTKSHIGKNHVVWSPKYKVVGMTAVVAILLARTTGAELRGRSPAGNKRMSWIFSRRRMGRMLAEIMQRIQIWS